jgi:hypothetical protein
LRLRLRDENGAARIRALFERRSVQQAGDRLFGRECAAHSARADAANVFRPIDEISAEALRYGEQRQAQFARRNVERIRERRRRRRTRENGSDGRADLCEFEHDILPETGVLFYEYKGDGWIRRIPTGIFFSDDSGEFARTNQFPHAPRR